MVRPQVAVVGAEHPHLRLLDPRHLREPAKVDGGVQHGDEQRKEVVHRLGIELCARRDEGVDVLDPELSQAEMPEGRPKVTPDDALVVSPASLLGNAIRDPVVEGVADRLLFGRGRRTKPTLHVFDLSLATAELLIRLAVAPEDGGLPLAYVVEPANAPVIIESNGSCGTGHEVPSREQALRAPALPSGPLQERPRTRLATGMATKQRREVGLGG